MDSDTITFYTVFTASIVTSLYNSTLSKPWSFNRYDDFLYFVNTVMLASQNSNKYTIIYSLKVVETYLKQFKVEPIESERIVFLTAFNLSQKYLDDFYYPPWEIDLSLLTELNSVQLKEFEWRFLDIIDYEITMTPTDYAKWEYNCQMTFLGFVVPITQSESTRYCDTVQENHGLLSPPSSVISNDYWTCNGEEDIFFNEINFYA